MSSLPDFDLIWNYADPAATELRFREILDTHHTISDLSYHLQLMTQIARTYSLRRMFDEAQAILDEIRLGLDEVPGIEHIRFYLEQGRVYNSSGDKTKAYDEFSKALAISDQVADDFHTVDTMHMLAIAANPNDAIDWNQQAIKKAESSRDERAKGWLGSLYNNLGWSYFGKKDFKKALAVFEKGLDWQVSKNREVQAGIARWSVARTLRAMGKIGKALSLQLELQKENKTADGYNYEEIAECLLELKRKDEARTYFAKAYDLLSEDKYMLATETVRLKRLKELSL